MLERRWARVMAETAQCAAVSPPREPGGPQGSWGSRGHRAQMASGAPQGLTERRGGGASRDHLGWTEKKGNGVRLVTQDFLVSMVSMVTLVLGGILVCRG